MFDATVIHNRKVAIIGTGNVGASIAYALTIRDLAREIVLINRTESRAIGEALDVDGKCGGYNLHWAFASGLTAGRSSAE